MPWHPIVADGVVAMRHAVHGGREHAPRVAHQDPAAGKKVWAQVLSIRKTKLLSDFYPHGKLSKELGIFVEEIGASGRANIIVDENGVIQWVKVYDIPQLPDIEEVFAELKKL